MVILVVQLILRYNWVSKEASLAGNRTDEDPAIDNARRHYVGQGMRDFMLPLQFLHMHIF